MGQDVTVEVLSGPGPGAGLAVVKATRRPWRSSPDPPIGPVVPGGSPAGRRRVSASRMLEGWCPLNLAERHGEIPAGRPGGQGRGQVIESTWTAPDRLSLKRPTRAGSGGSGEFDPAQYGMDASTTPRATTSTRRASTGVRGVARLLSRSGDLGRHTRGPGPVEAHVKQDQRAQPRRPRRPARRLPPRHRGHGGSRPQTSARGGLESWPAVAPSLDTIPFTIQVTVIVSVWGVCCRWFVNGSSRRPVVVVAGTGRAGRDLCVGACLACFPLVGWPARSRCPATTLDPPPRAPLLRERAPSGRPPVAVPAADSRPLRLMLPVHRPGRGRSAARSSAGCFTKVVARRPSAGPAG